MSVTDSGAPASTAAQPSRSPAGGYGAPGGGRRPPSKRGRWVLLGVLVVAVLAVIWILLQSHAPAEGGAAGAAGGGGRGGRGGGRGAAGAVTSVAVAKATVQDMPIYLTGLGTVTPEATVTVRTQIAGQLFSVAFREGQTVTKGQLLAQVDPRPYQQALAQAQGNLTRDQALLANARVDLQRYQTLLAQDSIARQQVDTQAATVRQYEGTIATDRAAVGAAKLNLAYTRITAPVGGKVGLRQVDPGNYVTTGDTNGLVTITQIDPIDVVFTLPEDSVSRVNQRMTGGAKLEVAAFDRSMKTQLDLGVLSTLDNQIDTTTGTVKAKARFSNGQGVLYPNQFVNVRLLVDTLRQTVAAPTAAVLRGQQGLFVYVVDANRTVHVRNITTGPAVGEITAVTQGLQGGETVVTDGSDRLRDGGRVSLPGDCPPPAGMGGGRGGRGGAGGPAAAGQAKSGGGFFGLFKKKDATPPQKPGVGPDGQRCNAVSYAQGGDSGPGGAARIQAIYAQLGLDAAQKAKIDTITTASRAQMAKLRTGGDYAGMRTARQAMQAQVNAVLRPDQRAKLAQLEAQARAEGGGEGGRGGGQAAQTGTGPGPAPGAAPAGANPAAPSTNAPPAPVAGGTASNFHGATAPLNPGVTASPQGGGGGGGGRMMAMLGQLDLDAGQQAKAQAIFAQARQQAGDDPDARRAAMRAAFGQLDAILRPEQKAKLAALRAQMRPGGGAGGGGGAGAPGAL